MEIVNTMQVMSLGVGFEGLIGRLAASSRALLGVKLKKAEQEYLEGILLEIQAGLNKVEKMQETLIQGTPVCLWVSDVKDVAYDLEDLCEEIELKAEASNLKLISSGLWKVDGAVHVFRRFPDDSTFVNSISMLMERLENLREGMKSLNIGSCFGKGKNSELFVRNRIIGTEINYNSGSLIPVEIQRIRISFGGSRGFKELVGELIPLTEALTTITPFYSDLPWHLKQCLHFCTLYPPGFTFEKDLLVLLWMAEGFVLPVVGKRLEDIGADYFDALLSWSFFQVSYRGSKCQSPTYELCMGYDHILRDYASIDNEFAQIRFLEKVVSEKTRHASCINQVTLNALSRLTGLHTLILFRNNPNRVKDVPFYFFLQLRYLRVLDLSGGCIKEVPRPVWDLLHLRYLDLSNNRIKILPEELANLCRLQTLRIDSCPISMFPQNFYKLVNLRHFHMDGSSNVFPPHIGRLTSLHTLPSFNVLRERGCSIEELNELNNLRGELFIKYLENVASLEEAGEAKLYAKQHLSSLKLQWSLHHINVNYDVIKGLRPHKNLSVLHIVHYRGSEFPSWISDPSFTNLVSITLFGCMSCKLPPLGRLPRLESLVIFEMKSVKHISCEFYGYGVVKRGFPSLLLLEVSYLFDLEDWDDFNEGDFPMLQELSISRCPKLKKLPEMKCLSSLQVLRICNCVELQRLPKNGFSNMVQSLEIIKCPKLAKRCQREKGADWNKIAHIQFLETDFL